MTSPAEHTQTSGDPRRGSALLLVMIMITVLLGTMSLLMVASISQSRNGTAGEAMQRAKLAADNALGKAIADVLVDPTTWAAQPDGTAVIDTEDNGAVLMDVEDNSSYQITFRLTAFGTYAGRTRTIEAIVTFESQKDPVVFYGHETAGPFVLGQGGFSMDDEVEIRGNDHGANRSMASIDSSDPPACLITSEIALLNSSVQTKGYGSDDWFHHDSGNVSRKTGVSAANAWFRVDGNDNNFDLLPDNGAADKPTRVGHLFGMGSEDGLKATAQASGTYFDNRTDFHDWAASVANGANKPKSGGKIVYVEMDNSGGPNNKLTDGEDGHVHLPPCEPGSNKTGEDGPCLVIITGSNQSNHDVEVDLKMDKGDFNGFVVIDHGRIFKDNDIYGGVFVFNEQDPEVELEDKLDINYSSEVLNDLPGTYQPGLPWDYHIDMWRERLK